MNWPTQSALIFLGAGVGANLRYWLGGWVQARIGEGFPWGTLLVNISGSLLIGLFLGSYRGVTAGHRAGGFWSP